MYKRAKTQKAAVLVPRKHDQIIAVLTLINCQLGSLRNRAVCFTGIIFCFKIARFYEYYALNELEFRISLMNVRQMCIGGLCSAKNRSQILAK